MHSIFNSITLVFVGATAWFTLLWLFIVYLVHPEKLSNLKRVKQAKHMDWKELLFMNPFTTMKDLSPWARNEAKGELEKEANKGEVEDLFQRIVVSDEILNGLMTNLELKRMNNQEISY